MSIVKESKKSATSMAIHTSSKRGANAMYQHYSRIYADRWEGLYRALIDNPLSVSISTGLQKAYFLDAASIVAAEFVHADAGDSVLDCCAAPGGKSLVLISNIIGQLFGRSEAAQPVGASDLLKLRGLESGAPHIQLNDRSSERRSRLWRVIREHVLPEFADQIRISSHDARRWGSIAPESFDKILVDVPCSSERHVLARPEHLAKWSTKRGQYLAQQSYTLLLSMLQTLKEGGRLVYATCSINTLENEKVVERALARFAQLQEQGREIGQGLGQGRARTQGRRLEQARASANFARRGTVHISIAQAKQGELPSWVEEREQGYIVLPDRANGRGPLYFCAIEKSAEK